MCKVIVGGLVALLFATVAQAQTGRHVSLGVGVGFHKYVDDRFSRKDPGVSLLYRIAWNTKTKDGWTWQPNATLDRASTDFGSDVGGSDIRIGKLRSIPVMAGVGRYYRHGRLKAGLSVEAGPSFNHFSIDGSARRAYQDRLGIDLESVTAKNSLAVRPGTSIWYDLSSRLGLHGSVGYFYNRPTTTTTAGGTASSEKWKTDYVSFSAGFAVGVF